MAADSGLEHRDTAVQPGPVPRRREVVWSCHELHPPLRISEGELRDEGTASRRGAGNKLAELILNHLVRQNI